MRISHAKSLFPLLFVYLVSSCGEPLSPADSLSTLTNQENTFTPAATKIDSKITASSTSAPTSTKTATLTATSSFTPTHSVTPTPLPPLLPAALYFIYPDAAAVDQIWRLEIDGKTRVQISREPLGITGLDINPIDGRIAYIANNSLFLAEADGENPQMIFEGPRQPDDWQLEDSWLWTQAISQPRWSPDGARIAISQNGILIIDTQSGETTKLIDNHIPPPEEIAQIMIYEPGPWSPNGEKILSKLRYYEGNSWVALPTSGEPGGNAFAWGAYNVTWNQDSQHAFVSVPGFWAYSRPGLWISETNSAEEQHLSGEIDPELAIGWPIQSPSGSLLFFMGGGHGYAQDGRPLPLMMYAASENSLLNARALRNERHIIRDVLWSPDASFAIIFEQSGQLTLLPADQRPSIPLVDLGNQKARDFRWGLPVAGNWQLPKNPALAIKPTPLADCPGIPASRLVVGDQARVTYTDGRRLRVRSSAEIVEDNIVRELIEGTRFVITAGPACVTISDGGQSYAFWEIFIPDYGLTAWAAEGAIEGGQEVYYIERWP